MSDPKQELEHKLKAYVGIETGPPTPAPEAVNESMIRHWCEAMGDRNPAYLDADVATRTVHDGIVAPPTMLQGWTLRGIEMADPSAMRKNKQTELHDLLSSYGYTSVVATNCDQNLYPLPPSGRSHHRNDRHRVDLRGEGDRARDRLLHQHP